MWQSKPHGECSNKTSKPSIIIYIYWKKCWYKTNQCVNKWYVHDMFVPHTLGSSLCATIASTLNLNVSSWWRLYASVNRLIWRIVFASVKWVILIQVNGLLCVRRQIFVVKSRTDLRFCPKPKLRDVEYDDHFPFQWRCNSAVCSTTCSTYHQRKYQSSPSPALCESNPSVTGGFPSQRAHTGQRVSNTVQRQW